MVAFGVIRDTDGKDAIGAVFSPHQGCLEDAPVTSFLPIECNDVAHDFDDDDIGDIILNESK